MPSSDFLQMAVECSLEDVRVVGNRYTWNNKQSGEHRIWSKIDRVMDNELWLELFERAEVNFLTEGLLDHSPAILSLNNMVPKCSKVFQFFTMWKTHPCFMT